MYVYPWSNRCVLHIILLLATFLYSDFSTMKFLPQIQLQIINSCMFYISISQKFYSCLQRFFRRNYTPYIYMCSKMLKQKYKVKKSICTIRGKLSSRWFHVAYLGLKWSENVEVTQPVTQAEQPLDRIQDIRTLREMLSQMS